MDNKIISVRFSGRLLNWYNTLEGNRSDIIKELIREGIERHQINLENYKLDFSNNIAADKKKVEVTEVNEDEVVEDDDPVVEEKKSEELVWDFK